MARVIDVSMVIRSDMPVYKNRAEKRPAIEVVKDFPEAGLRESRVSLDCHTGTHLDAPLHVFQDGPGIDCYDLSILVGPCRVLDFSDVDVAIGEQELGRKKIQPGEFILCKTKNSSEQVFNSQYVYLTEQAARYLANLPIRGVGIDALGIERDQPGHPTHKSLLEKNIPILEGLRLSEVKDGNYFLVALPLPLETEAAPARVILLEGGWL